MKHKAWPRQPCCTGQSCPQSQVQTGTRKVDPARKFKCTPTARVLTSWLQLPECNCSISVQSQLQYKLGPERLTRLGNSNVLRLPVFLQVGCIYLSVITVSLYRVCIYLSVIAVSLYRVCFSKVSSCFSISSNACLAWVIFVILS